MKRDYVNESALGRRRRIEQLLTLAGGIKAGPQEYRRALSRAHARDDLRDVLDRTRVSFEAGMFQLGGLGLFLSSRDIQLGRGEPISDTAQVLSRYVDGIMARTFAHNTVDGPRAVTPPCRSSTGSPTCPPPVPGPGGFLHDAGSGFGKSARLPALLRR